MHRVWVGCLPMVLFVAAAMLIAPAATAEPPADAFCVILIEPSADFTQVRVLVDEDSTLDERAALWPSVDLDHNGVITPVEKDAFRWSNTRVLLTEADLGVKAVTLLPSAPYTTSTHQKPVYATTWRQVGHVFHHRDYELPDRLTSTTELETQEVREFGFELEPDRSSRFTLSGGRTVANLSAAPTYIDQPRPVIEYVVVRAPAGWVVERIEGSSYNGTFVLAPDEASVDVPAFDTTAPFNITFFNASLHERLGYIGSPGPSPGALVFLFAVAGLIWFVRRRHP